MGGPAGVLGRSSGVLGLAWGFMGGAWCVLGVAWSVLGGPWEVLQRPLRRLWDPWRSLGGPREVTRGPWTSLGGSLRVLGGPWEGLPLIVPGGSLWLMRGTRGRQGVDKGSTRCASGTLRMRPDRSRRAQICHQTLRDLHLITRRVHGAHKDVQGTH